MIINVRHAVKTLAAIDAQIESDQGTAFRGFLKHRMPESADAYEPSGDDFRRHLGGSMIGRECARHLWYNFHWVKASKFNSKTLRLFNRGHLEEPRFVAMLQAIGCTVYQINPTDGEQYRISYFGGHFGSAIDGVIIGCPDVPDEPILSEFKTHNDDSFQKLKKEGMRSSKYEHFAQMQVYMRSYGLRYGLYLAVNKNTDELYAEIIELDVELADQLIERAGKIVFADEPPPKINQSPGFYKCKWCDHKAVCHQGETPAKNCRTCKNSKPLENGEWGCMVTHTYLDKRQQLSGCDQYQQREV